MAVFVVSMLSPLIGSAQSVPPDGLYRVDLVGSMSTPRSTLSQATDGATGNAQVELDADGARSATHFSGNGPQTVCLHKGAPPAALAAQRCANLRTRQNATGGSVHAACPSMDVKQSWRRIDDRTWESTSDVKQDLAATTHAAADARAALSMASAHGTAAERAQAQAAMAGVPQQAQIDAMRAQVRASMEEALRTASPDEAAQIRATMATMGGHTPATQMHTHVVQRYTRLGETCTP